MTEPASGATPAPGRECGSCTMCCKLLTISALAKPRDAWCTHCKPGKGCTTYDTRPAECRGFFCTWMLDGGFAPEWRPDRARFMLTIVAGGRVVVHCDASAPAAWRREPFYSTIKAWVARRAGGQQEVLVRTGGKAIFVTAGGEIDLGEAGPNDQIVATYDQFSRLVGARVVPAGDKSSAGAA
jgi:hypothetical protein